MLISRHKEKKHAHRTNRRYSQSPPTHTLRRMVREGGWVSVGTVQQRGNTRSLLVNRARSHNTERGERKRHDGTHLRSYKALKKRGKGNGIIGIQQKRFLSTLLHTHPFSRTKHTFRRALSANGTFDSTAYVGNYTRCLDASEYADRYNGFHGPACFKGSS